MKISGFTFIRNGNKFDFPYKESFLSLIPLVDELVIAVGNSDDNTLATVQELANQFKNKEIKIIETIWDENLRKGGAILAEQTNIALSHCTGDWCIYIQGDEVLHENDYEEIKKSIVKANEKNDVDGILLNYHHFYGNYSTVNKNRSNYKREIRIVRGKNAQKLKITSCGDAQGFKLENGEKLKAIASKAFVYHYGWVRPQETMKKKTHYMDSLYHGKEVLEKEEIPTGDNYKYKHIVGLKKFEGTHPQIMKDRILRYGEGVDPLKLPLIFKGKDAFKVMSHIFEDITGIRPFEYKNFILKR